MPSGRAIAVQQAELRQGSREQTQQVPRVIAQASSVWAQYTVVVERVGRDALAAALKDAGIPTAVYYPRPLHLQGSYRHYPVAGGGLPVAEQLSRQVLSLPMHPYLEPAIQAHIVDAVRQAATSLSRRREPATSRRHRSAGGARSER